MCGSGLALRVGNDFEKRRQENHDTSEAGKWRKDRCAKG